MCLTNIKNLDCEIGDFFEKEVVNCCIIPKAKKKAGIHEAYASFPMFWQSNLLWPNILYSIDVGM